MTLVKQVRRKYDAEFLTSTQVAQRLNVCATTVRMMVRRKELPQPITIGGRFRFPLAQFEDWLKHLLEGTDE